MEKIVVQGASPRCCRQQPQIAICNEAVVAKYKVTHSLGLCALLSSLLLSRLRLTEWPPAISLLQGGCPVRAQVSSMVDGAAAAASVRISERGSGLHEITFHLDTVCTYSQSNLVYGGSLQSALYASDREDSEMIVRPTYEKFDAAIEVVALQRKPKPGLQPTISVYCRRGRTRSALASPVWWRVSSPRKAAAPRGRRRAPLTLQRCAAGQLGGPAACTSACQTGALLPALQITGDTTLAANVL